MSVQQTGAWHVSQIALGVDDLDAAVVFYRDTLEVPFIARPSPGLAFFDCDGVRLMLSSGGDGGARCACTSKFRTSTGATPSFRGAAWRSTGRRR